MARTPSREAHEKVLAAALTLIAERGIEGASMEAIAGAAGVSKATVYKHWENKDALLIEVVGQSSGKLPEFDSGDARADLTALLRYLAQARKPRELAKIWPRLIGYAVSNPAFARALQDHTFAPRRAQIARLLKQASANGELRRNIDAEFAMDMLVGPIMHRRFADEKNIPADFPERVVESFWKAFEPARR